MSDRLNQYFNLVSNYRKTTNPIKRKIILEQGMPMLAAGTGSVRLRKSISKFIEENTSGIESNQHAG
jgi:hypothetical protein